MKDELTIIIPCKNEGRILWECIKYVAQQDNIFGTKVIIADSSNTLDSLEWINELKKDFGHTLNLDIIKGGFPAAARLAGSKLAITQRILFLDADIMLTQPSTLNDTLKINKDLVTLTMETEMGWNWVYRGFDFFQSVGHFFGTPFAVGGFQLWKINAYWKTGGYDSENLFAEDYALSKCVSRKEFKVLRRPRIWTSARRFKQKGIMWMFIILIKSYINRNNPRFFKSHHGYWE